MILKQRLKKGVCNGNKISDSIQEFLENYNRDLPLTDDDTTKKDKKICMSCLTKYMFNQGMCKFTNK